MKISKISMLLALMIMVLFTSCKKEEVDSIVTVPEVIKVETVEANPLVYNLKQNNNTTGTLDLGCFAIDLPFGMLMTDGSSTTINVEEDFEILFQDSSNVPVDFIYPLNVTYTDGETAVLNNAEELGEAFASCVPDTGWGGSQGFPAYLICDINSCYQLVYPIELHDENGNIITIADEEAFIDAIAQNLELYFEFPFDMTDPDGNMVQVTDQDQLFELLYACDNIGVPGDSITIDPTNLNFFGCLEIVYPFNITNPAGTVISIADEDALYTAFLNGDFYQFAYPMSFLNQDGAAITIASEEDLLTALLDCETGDVPFLAIYLNQGVISDCYEVTYPVTAVEMNNPSNTISVENDGDLMSVSFDTTFVYSVNLPITILVNSSNELVEIHSTLELDQILGDCQ